MNIVKKLKADFKKFIIVLASSILTGICLYFILSDSYYTQARFITISGDNKNLSLRGIQKLSSIAGINIGDNKDEFDPLLIKDVVYSNELFEYILEQNVPLNLNGGDSMVFLQYYVNDEYPGIGSYSEIKTNEAFVKPDGNDIVNKKYIKLKKDFFSTITYEIDFETNVFTLGVKLENSTVSHHVLIKILHYIEEYIINFQIQKKKREIEYLQKRKEKSQADYKSSGLKIAAFLSDYQDLFDEQIKFKYQLLKNEHNINYNVLNEISTQLELEKFALEEKRPILYLLEEPAINLKSSKKSFPVIIGMMIFLFMLIYIFILFRKEIIKFVSNV